MGILIIAKATEESPSLFSKKQKTKIKVSFYGQIKLFEKNIPYQIANIFLFSAHLIVYCHWEGGKTPFLD